MPEITYKSYSKEIQELKEKAKKYWDKGQYEQAHQAEFDVKWLLSIQKQYIKQDYSHFIESWFTTNDPQQKLNLVLKYGIVELGSKGNLDKFVTKSKFNQKWGIHLQKIRHWIYDQYQSVCVYCGDNLTKSSAVLEHVIPSSAWPEEWQWLSNDSSNLVAACNLCNSRKNNNLLLPEVQMLHVRHDSCMPNQLDGLGYCIDASALPCSVCGIEPITIFCNVHKRQPVHLCKLTVLATYFGHD
jgi:hypothetical protein